MPVKGSSEGIVFFNKQRKRWNAQYSDYDVQTGKIKKKTKSFKTEEEAKKYLANIMYQKENPIYIEHKGIPLCEVMKSNLRLKMATNQITPTQFERVIRTIEKIEKVIKAIREVNKDVIIMVDNCYGEFVQDREPIEVGADIAVGSLMKNLGAGIATSGAYIVGKRELIELCAERLTSPGIGKEIGPSLNQNTLLLKGLFFAPSVVASSIKTAVFASRILEELGYQVEPKFDEERADIVQTIALGTEEKLVKFCQGIQMGSPIDSKVIPYPGDMGGYEDKVIMAAGTFTQGSTIELSCDGPIRPPYIAYMQGGLTYEYGKMGILKAIEYMEK